MVAKARGYNRHHEHCALEKWRVAIWGSYVRGDLERSTPSEPTEGLVLVPVGGAAVAGAATKRFEEGKWVRMP